MLINNHQRAYLFIVAGKVAWGRLGKSISLNSGFACEIAPLNFDSFDQNRKKTEVRKWPPKTGRRKSPISENWPSFGRLDGRLAKSLIPRRIISR